MRRAILLIFLSLSACSSNLNPSDSSLPAPAIPPTPVVVVPPEQNPLPPAPPPLLPDVTDIADIDDEELPDLTPPVYVYDPATKECRDENSLIGLNLGAILSCSDQSNIKIINQNLAGENLSGISFEGSTLVNVDFTSGNITGADFSDSYLDEVNFTGAKVDDSDFSNAEIHNSDLRDYEVIDRLVENGLEVGLNNQLPPILTEIELIITEETDLATRHEIAIDEFIERDPASDRLRGSDSLDELRARAESLREKIKEQLQAIEDNKAKMRAFRERISDIKALKKEMKNKANKIKEEIRRAKQQIARLVARKKELSAKFRDLKEELHQAKDEKQKQKIHERLREIKNSRDAIVTEIKGMRENRSEILVAIKIMRKEIDNLLNKVSGEKKALVRFQERNADHREVLKAKVNQFKTTRQKIKDLASL